TGDSAHVLTVKVDASRLSTDETVGIEVLGVPVGTGEVSSTACAEVRCTFLQQVRVGPNDSGDVDETVTVHVPPGRFERVIARGLVCSKSVGAPPSAVDAEDEDGTSGTSTTSTSTTSTTPGAPTPEAPQVTDAAPTRDECSAIEALTGFALVATPPSPALPVLSVARTSDGGVDVTAKAVVVHSDAALCGLVTVEGRTLAAAAAQGTSSGAATFTLPIADAPKGSEVTARAWVAVAPCAEPPEGSALLRFAMAGEPTTTPTSTPPTTMPAPR
ncbi:MAG: hypothetical protein ABL966_11790, partial [Acidimicrobiales bacterium]